MGTKQGAGRLGLLLYPVLPQEKDQVQILGANQESMESSPTGSAKPPPHEGRVLKQLLFENPEVKDKRHPFKADGSTGSFGQTWVKRGIVRISDLWSKLLGSWKTLEDIKQPLRGLQRVEDNWRNLIQGIPQERRLLLGPEGVDPEDTWYVPDHVEEPNVLWKVREILPSGFRRIERWRCEGPANVLILVEQDTVFSWNNPAQARVLEVRGKRPSALTLTWVGRLPINQLCVDPSAWRVRWGDSSEHRRILGLPGVPAAITEAKVSSASSNSTLAGSSGRRPVGRRGRVREAVGKPSKSPEWKAGHYSWDALPSGFPLSSLVAEQGNGCKPCVHKM
ncbi:hypothetical protein CBR_g42168 [Chara braunii]|uniref:Uncharacterized protein n=1 Tax=Chara braunii TaxID=69332 RepID=A0A388LX35_CHABU|nr:hypothetical protein CBR_g42168 [Chara braunii]|eukprot:GBG86884.1 hypothetical protein CBR_g42168 [Chara braunii]